jgi:hypothetical protein
MRSAEQPTNPQRNQCSREGLFFNKFSGRIANGTDQF